MSKDMLGSLVRASVNLTQPRVNVSLDVINRLNGNDGAAWETHLKSVLRSGLPSQPQSPPTSKSAVLKLVNDTIRLYDDAAPQDPQEFFKTRKGLWVSDEFKSRILSKAKLIDFLDPVTLVSRELTKNAHDREITPELGEDYLFDESEVCAHIATMIDKQPNGIAGDLLNNSYANLFYVAGCVVVVFWSGGGREWNVYAWLLADVFWDAGSRVFSGN